MPVLLTILRPRGPRGRSLPCVTAGAGPVYADLPRTVHSIMLNGTVEDGLVRRCVAEDANFCG